MPFVLVSMPVHFRDVKSYWGGLNNGFTNGGRVGTMF